jgi:hypothetical protein
VLGYYRLANLTRSVTLREIQASIMDAKRAMDNGFKRPAWKRAGNSRASPLELPIKSDLE